MNKHKSFLAQSALNLIKDGMIVGVGGGSTVRFFVEALAEFVRDNNLHIKFVAADKDLEDLAAVPGVTLLDINNVIEIDILFDGADYVNLDTGMVSKGNGGCIAPEMFLAKLAKKSILLIDDSKLIWSRLPKVFLEVSEDELPEVFNSLEGYVCFLRKGFSVAGNLVVEVSLDSPDLVDDLLDAAKEIPGILVVGVSYKKYDCVWISRSDNDRLSLEKFNLKND